MEILNKMSNSIRDAFPTQTKDLIKRSSYMKNKKHVKRISFPSKIGGLQKGGLFLILILVILGQKSLGLTPLDPKEVPHTRDYLLEHKFPAASTRRDLLSYYTSIWSPHLVRKKQSEKRKKITERKISRKETNYR